MYLSSDCCTQDFSEEELILLDDAEKEIDLISESEKNSLFYVSGYIAFKE
jgi:hypothetical protein